MSAISSREAGVLSASGWSDWPCPFMRRGVGTSTYCRYEANGVDVLPGIEQSRDTDLRNECLVPAERHSMVVGKRLDVRALTRRD